MTRRCDTRHDTLMQYTHDTFVYTTRQRLRDHLTPPCDVGEPLPTSQCYAASPAPVKQGVSFTSSLLAAAKTLPQKLLAAAMELPTKRVMAKAMARDREM